MITPTPSLPVLVLSLVERLLIDRNWEDSEDEREERHPFY